MNRWTRIVLGSATIAVALTAITTRTLAEPPAATANERALALKVDDPALQWGACPPIFPAGCRITVLHGDPAQPGADVFLQVPGGYKIPAHSHTSAERMVLVTGELEVTYLGQPAVVLAPGQYAFGPAKLPHVARCRSTDPCTLFIAFNGSVDAQPFEGEIVATPL